MSLKLIKNWNKHHDKVTQCFEFRELMAIERSYLKMINEKELKEAVKLFFHPGYICCVKVIQLDHFSLLPSFSPL